MSDHARYRGDRVSAPVLAMSPPCGRAVPANHKRGGKEGLRCGPTFRLPLNVEPHRRIDLAEDESECAAGRAAIAQRPRAVWRRAGEIAIIDIQRRKKTRIVRPCIFVDEATLGKLVGMTADEYIQHFGRGRRVLRSGEVKYAVSKISWNVAIETEQVVAMTVESYF